MGLGSGQCDGFTNASFKVSNNLSEFSNPHGSDLALVILGSGRPRRDRENDRNSRQIVRAGNALR